MSERLSLFVTRVLWVAVFALTAALTILPPHIGVFFSAVGFVCWVVTFFSRTN